MSGRLGLIGLHRLRDNIWTKTLFFVLAVIAFLVLDAALSLSAGAIVTGTDDAVSDSSQEVIADATGDVVTEVPDEPVSDSPEDSVAEALDETASDSPGDVVADEPEDAIEDAIEDNSGVVDEVVDEAIQTGDPNSDIVEGSVLFDEGGLDVDIPVLGDEPVVDLIEENPVVVEDISSVLDDALTALPPMGVDMVGVLQFLTPEVPVVTPEVNVAPAMLTVAPVAVGGSSFDLGQATPATETVQPPSLANALYGEQLGAELALVGLSNVTSHPATGPGLSSSPGEENVPDLAPYTPLPRPVPVERGPAAASQGGSTHAGGGHFGAIDPYGFFAAMATLLALCVVGWIRDRSRSGRSIFPSHGGRPG